MTAVEDRLRSELRAESEMINPDSLLDLRLPDVAQQAGRPLATLRRRGSRRWARRRWSGWALPLSAAAAVVAVIVGALVVVRAVSVAPAGPAAPPHAPAYYAVAVQTGARQHGFAQSIDVRSVATGNLLTRVSVPRPYNNFSWLAAATDTSVFVFGAERYTWQARSHLWNLDPSAPEKFLMLRITPGGAFRLTSLSVTAPVQSMQAPSIALSPDGRRLAVASWGEADQTAVVRVVTLATGAARQWSLPHASWLPELTQPGAWSADGHTLMIDAIPNVADPGVHLPKSGPTTTGVRLLDTAKPGSSLAASRYLSLAGPAGEDGPWTVFLSPDGTELIGSVVANVTDKPGHIFPASGSLVAYSARTGRLLRRFDGWSWRGNTNPLQAVLWSDASAGQLLVFQPRAGAVTLGVFTGGTFRTAGAPLPHLRSAYLTLQHALIFNTPLYSIVLSG